MSAIENAAIIGPGIIGSSWALVFARAGLGVRIWERREKKAALDRVEALIRNLQGTGLDGDGQTLGRISVLSSIEETLDGVDYVEESIAENLEAKKSIFNDVERYADPSAIVASSTSALLTSQLAKDLAHPERFLVVHPLTPPSLRSVPLL
jgi:L-gulonate 3-dehydrogenase